MSSYRRVKESRGNYPKPQDTAKTQSMNYQENKAKERQAANLAEDELDAKFGFERFTGDDSKEKAKLGWMFNVRTTSLVDESNIEHSAIDMYFVQEDGSTFKASLIYQPYFLIHVKGSDSQWREVEEFLNRRFERLIASIVKVQKEDLDLPNHLSGLKNQYFKLSFRNVQDLLSVRKYLLPIVMQNKKEQEALETYGVEDTSISTSSSAMGAVEEADEPWNGMKKQRRTRAMDLVMDIREYDVTYNQRVLIDMGCRVGLWYEVIPVQGTQGVSLKPRPDLLDRPITKTMAWDIETTKLPLKFPNAEFDQIMMISYMIDGQGYLIVNREIVSEDIEDFEYTPKEEYPGPFQIFNEKNEQDTLHRFLSHIKLARPLINVTYNGDFFDWPFVDKRCSKYGISLKKEIGVWADNSGEYMGRFMVHLDAFHWVQRDSYLPQGSQGLKAVTKAKLKYDPVELDPEDMLPFASEKPQELAAYSVSDAVATYYLYKKYVHLFIFSLCTIIPMPPSDVLRKGSGTLCELLLMVQAYQGDIVCPNKQTSTPISFHKGHLLESETYIGGHVECLESGVFRADIPYKFRMNPLRLQRLIDSLDRTLEFALVDEQKVPLDQVTNFNEIKAQIESALITLRDKPNIETTPLIYHLDVGAMYPNIILTNRLQPMAIVDQAVCAACDFNRPGNQCQRHMKWSWRGQYFPAKRSEYEWIRAQLEYDAGSEKDKDGKEGKAFSELNEEQQAAKIKARMKSYSQKVYKKMHVETVEEREAIICQRENSFYVDTVRAFRDRRYDYKALTKKAQKAEREAKDAVSVAKAKDLVLLYDSLQLAHKCILNSFYGYVMRKGARWHSIEMAGVVTQTGSNIIKDARMLVQDIGRVLELDTDGIWCMLPSAFPENFTFKTTDNRSISISYPCVMLNVGVAENYSNHQYQTLVDPSTHRYECKSECSIFFEVDGPYRAMLLPAAREEGKNIKKRYAVFNKDGTLAELKGFEIKRRGELKLIKYFQGQIFKTFLDGGTIEECYEAVGKVANHWLDVLENEGRDLTDEDLFDLISENKNMTAALAEYGNARSTAITCAKRLSEFLGEEMTKDKGLNCHFIISRKPLGSSVSERAVPVAIFSAEPAVKMAKLKQWLRDSSLESDDIRDMLDWDYYTTRLGSAIQKIVTIPAAFQKVRNPVPRVAHPEWLNKKVREFYDEHRQTRISGYFLPSSSSSSSASSGDIEDTLNATQFSSPLRPKLAKVSRKKLPMPRFEEGADGEEEKRAASEDKGHIDIEVDDAEGGEDGEEGGEVEIDLYPDSALMQREEKKAKAVEKAPDPKTDMQGWIKYQKRHWDDLKEKRKAIHNGSVSSSSGLQLGSGGLRSFLQQAAHNIKTNYWQVVQCVEDEAMPGYFRLWVFTDAQTLQTVLVNVPRVIYLNCRSPNAMGELLGKRVDRQLPRSRPASHLYAIESSEREYLESGHRIASMLNESEVEGIYESKTPLLMKLIMELGCVCKPDPKADFVRNEFQLSQLQFKSTAECPYLSNVSLKKIFLYHSACDDRGLWCMYVEGSSKADVMVVHKYGAVDRLNIKSLHKTLQQHMGKAEEEVASIAFAVSTVKDDSKAHLEVRRWLASYSSSPHPPTIVLAQCCDDLAALYQAVPVLKSDFPVVSIPLKDTDNKYPLLQWYQYAVSKMLVGLENSWSWYESQLSFCQYAHVPIGNLESDPVTFACDIFYARALSESNHLMWVSSGPRPDLGGLEEDENYFEEEHHNPELSYPGCYRDLCLVLKLEYLSVNTVVQADLIEELEGAMGLRAHASAVQGADGEMGMVSGSYACKAAFAVMKKMLQAWLVDALHHGNPDAELLCSQFYRWLKSPSSKLHDPALFRMVHKMMQKVFLQLLSRIRKLGSTVVHASFSKVIISTGKPTAEHALAYYSYLRETIKSRPLFEYVMLGLDQLYASLLFMDRANYGGLTHPLSDQAALIEQEAKEGDVSEHNIMDRIVMEWNISHFLPLKASRFFLMVVNEFCLTPYKHLQNLRHAHPSQDQSQSEQFATPQQQRDRFEAYLRDLINTSFSRRLFGMMKDIRQDSSGDGEEDFPRPAGSHLVMKNQALEFVKAVCHVLSLDGAVKLEVQKLRENLMRLLDVKAFSEKAQFVNPCLTYVLPDVVCPFCSSTRDLDLCRDAQLTQRGLVCNSCEQAYDVGVIEAELVDIVTRRSVSYQVQDLSCVNCSKIKTLHLAQFCSCSGQYALQSSSQSFATYLKTFAGIAQHYKLEWLAETVQWIQGSQL